MSNPSQYFMDDPREAKRLADKVDAALWVSRYVSPRIGTAARVLDVGCGPGVLASAVAHAHPLVNVTGIELSADRIDANIAKRFANVTLQAGDARELPFPEDSFGFCYCRFLLEYLSERQTVVDELCRVCEPGGRVLLQDLDGQLVWHYPEDVQLQADIHRVLTVLDKTGFDPFVGRKLFALAKSSGLTGIDVQVEPYHLYAGAIDDQNLGLWETKLDIALPAAAKALGGDAAARSLKSRFLSYLRRDDTLTYSVQFTVTGRRERDDT